MSFQHICALGPRWSPITHGLSDWEMTRDLNPWVLYWDLFSGLFDVYWDDSLNKYGLFRTFEQIVSNQLANHPNPMAHLSRRDFL